MNIRENVSFSELTTMRLGGNARYVIEIQDADDLIGAYDFADEKSLPVVVLGGGSNTIARDGDFSGVILLNKIVGIEALSDNDGLTIIRCGSGVVLDVLVDFAVAHGLTGIESMSLIPGTVGGAVVQNAGAYGQDLSQVLTKVSAYDAQKRQVVELDRDSLDFSYRQSIFNSSDRGHYFITAIDIELRRGEITDELYKSLQAYLDEHNITNRSPLTVRQAVIDIRSNKLPDPAVEPSAGSFFHNVTVTDAQANQLRADYPDVPIFRMNDKNVLSAGWLIEKCGLKGKTIHGMRISDKAALVLINDSATSYADLDVARSEIMSAVRDKFGLILEQEPEEI